MIHSIQQKQFIEVYINLTLDNGCGTYILVLQKTPQGNTIDKWLLAEDNSRIINPDLLKYAVEQFNKDTETPKPQPQPQ